MRRRKLNESDRFSGGSLQDEVLRYLEVWRSVQQAFQQHRNVGGEYSRYRRKGGPS